MYYLISVSVGVALNLGLNFLLIPKYGMKAAALTTLLGYLAVFVLVYIFSERLYPCDYGVWRAAIAIIALYAACFYLEGTELWLRVVVWIVLMAAVLWLFREVVGKFLRFLLRRGRR